MKLNKFTVKYLNIMGLATWFIGLIGMAISLFSDFLLGGVVLGVLTIVGVLLTLHREPETAYRPKPSDFEVKISDTHWVDIEALKKRNRERAAFYEDRGL